MFKRILCVFCSVVMVFSMISPAVYADDEIMNHEHNWVDVPVSLKGEVFGMEYQVSIKHCTICNLYDHTISLAGYSYEYFAMTAAPGVEGVIQNLAIKLYCSIFGENATATKFQSGGGSTSGGGVGRPKGYSDDSGTANISSTGAFQVVAHPVYNTHSLSSSAFNSSWFSQGNCIDNDGKFYLRCLPNSIYVCNTVHDGEARHLGDFFYSYAFDAPVDGLYYCDETVTFENFWNHNNLGKPQSCSDSFSQKFSAGKNRRFNVACSISLQAGEKYGDFQIPYSYTVKVHDIVLNVIPETVNITNYNSLTVNNNTWNGNIYVDNSNSLTYIYPQYTTVNEKNETVTNISNTPIIYNNEIYQYYTYDQTTKNYYYITYPNQPTPPPTATPSPTPDPDTEHPVRDMYYRWILTERRSTDDGGYNAIQVSELEFYDKDKNLISWPSDVSIKSSLDTSWNEPITNLVDNKINNKWGCNRWGSGKTGKCVIDIYAPNMQIPSYYGYVTGSDMPARDPVSWKLYYSFDGVKYYEASTMEQATDIPTDRNAKTEKWPFNYQSPTPSPSPTPAPTEKPGGSISTPETGKPGGDTGDTTGILAVLVKIRDNMIQGFLDIKAAFVAGFAELSANFTLAIENLNLNITNIFNKKFPDQSTPETAPPSPSPSPSPSPAPLDPILPETQNLIIPKMNSNTFTDEHGTWVASGSSKYSDVFDFFHAFDRSTSDFWETNASPSYLQIEIPDPENYYVDGYIMRISKFTNRYAKEWTLQGSDDGKTWDDLNTQKDQNLSDMQEHKYTLTLRKAYKYYRLNMSNYASSMCSLSHFNLLGYDAKDVVTPTPAPTGPPSPSPAPDPGKPDSGDKTNNFWTIIFPNGGGSEDGKKGIFWALVSLILALIAFFANLAVGVGYLFPFLPDGVVMTINTCLIVIFLFTIIKFIMRSK